MPVERVHPLLGHSPGGGTGVSPMPEALKLFILTFSTSFEYPKLMIAIVVHQIRI